MFREGMFNRMQILFNVKVNRTGKSYTTEQVAAEITRYDGLVTAWGSPVLTAEVFERADRLKVIAHAAGSVKFMLSQEVVERCIVPRGIVVISANRGIAENVAEATIGMMIMAGRRWVDHALAFRERGVWRDRLIPANGRYLRGSVVGIVGASKVGREVIALLRPFHVKILLYDPYLPAWEAGRLDVEITSLDDLFSQADYITIHAPMIPETERMIGERHLRLMRNGAVLINTSRGRVIDHDALLRELRTGRILAALDVTDPEPLPPDSPFRFLPNVIILPHISGAGSYGYHRVGEITLRGLEDVLLLGKIPEEAVPLERYGQLA
jgi:phosphoglycerate dehydrogenase-like enzyme